MKTLFAAVEDETYEGLPAACKVVMRAKALVGVPTNKSPFLACMTRSGSRAPDGRGWSTAALNMVLDILVRKGLLDQDLACPAPLRHAIAMDAVASEEGGFLVRAIRDAFPPRGQGNYLTARIDPIAMQVLIRLAVYANDEAGLAENAALYEKSCPLAHTAILLADHFSAAPIGADWFAGRAEGIRAALLEALVERLATTGTAAANLPALVAFCRTQPATAGIAASLLRHDLLAARLGDVTQGIAAIDAGQPLLRHLMSGATAFLGGANDDALVHYRAALKARRRQQGKRRLFLAGEHAFFFVMALLKADDAGLHGEIEAGFHDASPVPSRDAGFLALQALLWLVQGREAAARNLLAVLRAHVPPEPLGAACVMLAVHEIAPDASRGHVADLEARFTQTRDTLPLVARIHAELLIDILGTHGAAERHLAATGAGFGVAFTALVKSRAPWERALETLGALLHPDSGKPEKPAAARAKRLAWFIDPATGEVTAVEQIARGRDGWSDGRAVALKRLVARDPKLDYLTQQDLAALRGIRRDSSEWDGSDLYFFNPLDTIPALVGHPFVFDVNQRSVPMELVAGRPELVVTERRGGYHLALSHHSREPTLFLEAETPTRLRVIAFSSDLLPVQEILGRDGLTVPKHGRDQIVAIVKRSQPSLPVRAEIADLGSPALPGQPAPVVQLVPVEGALKLSLVVRPFGAEGPAWVAGLGGRSVLAAIAGEQRRATRDLPREVAERQALVDACPTLRDRCGADVHELVIDDPEGQLEVLLELRAFGAQVEWPEGKRLRVSLLTGERMRLRVGQDRGWFSVDGTIAVDEDRVVEMRFLLDRLGRAQGRFVPLEDGSFVALTRQLQAQLERLAAVSEGTKSGLRVHALGAPALRDVLEEAGEVRADAAWKKHVSRISAAEGFLPVVPAGLQAELRDYQVEGFAWMSRLARWGAGACLADDMGLGKTVQAIAIMVDRAADGPCLVVAPTSVCPNWISEITRFAPTLVVHRLAGALDRAALVAGLGPLDVLVCSYGLLHTVADLLGGRHWQMAVLDEAQAIKNAATRRAQATLNLHAGFRLALTGTPVENYLDDLWSLFNFVNPGLLGSREGFQKRFSGPIERDRDVPARNALRALVRPFLLRRTKAAVLSELPPRTEQTVQVQMSEAERAFYEALRQRALAAIAALSGAPGARKIHILAEITRLRRACCNPALIDAAAGVPSGKLAALMELVEDLLRNRHKALVFSQFTGHLALVRAALDARNVRYEYLDGSTPSAERERRVAAFQSGSADLFLISLRAGGTGLNLTAADYVVHLDPWWNPAVEDQASDRAHRIGQARPVTVYRLIMQDSIEERIVRLHRDKRDLASDLLDGAETSGRLSEAQLLDLIRA